MMNRVFLNSYCVWPLDLIKVLPENISASYYTMSDPTGTGIPVDGIDGLSGITKTTGKAVARKTNRFTDTA